MNPFESSIEDKITRFKNIKLEIQNLQSEEKIIENEIQNYFKNQDISEYKNCYIGYTTRMKSPNYNDFELKPGVDSEKIKIEVPYSWVEFKEKDTNGNDIDLSKVKVKLTTIFQEKYPELVSKSGNIKLRKESNNDLS